MNKTVETQDLEERELARRFAQLRLEERADTPDFPVVQTLQRDNEVPVVRRYRLIEAGALAASLALVVLFVSESPLQEDPGEIYASIMGTSEITTDQLMLVSPGTLPEVTAVPGIYEIDIHAFGQSPED